MKRQTQHVYAVFRVDTQASPTTGWNNRITIKEILLTQKEAELEVSRLNKLNAGKGCVYHWQVSRLVGGEVTPVSRHEKDQKGTGNL